MVFAGIYIADKKKLAHIHLISPARLSSFTKICQLGSAWQIPAQLGSAQLANFQLGCNTSIYLYSEYLVIHCS